MRQLELLDPPVLSEGVPDLASYDFVVVAFSGGKDSVACLLHLLESGVPRDRIELHHHHVDGREGDSLMDWPSTPGYCKAVADAFGLPLISSWKVGGFEREMLRDQAPTAATRFETRESGVMTVGGVSGKLGTRLKFPQTGASLSTRWCSAYLKIDVLDKVLVNSPAYQRARTLVVTGERAQESANRAHYAKFEPGRAHAPQSGRHVDHWRPIHGWTEKEVWAALQRHGVVPHPAYRLGFGRLSCMTCIFAGANQWATIRALAPDRFKRIAERELQFGCTINRKKTVRELADLGTPYPAALANPELYADALKDDWTGAVLVPPEAWVQPAGAFGESNGPS